jgi:hypothetical protein
VLSCFVLYLGGSARNVMTRRLSKFVWGTRSRSIFILACRVKGALPPSVSRTLFNNFIVSVLPQAVAAK